MIQILPGMFVILAFSLLIANVHFQQIPIHTEAHLGKNCLIV